MKYALALVACLLLVGAAGRKTYNDCGDCAQIKVNSCGFSRIIIQYFKPGEDEVALTLPAPKGCRCSFTINGNEYVNTAPMPDEWCMPDREIPDKQDKHGQRPKIQ